ncbi:MAG: alanine dehydrogenase [Gammaproteobacteria bacterium]|nr:alanine dehydrogenase [Gammaproteobacteria bacterium]
MRIGIPTEVKSHEGRVALIPAACKELLREDNEVYVERDAGFESGFSDEDYRAVGARICRGAAELYARAELVVKVKEPIDADLVYLRREHLLFCFLHLAANRELAARLRDIGLTAIAFETVEHNGALPLLAPMSEIAGRLSVQVATHLLHQPQGGSGIMLGGLAAAERGNVVVLGAGVAGGAAAAVAAALGANVTVFDLDRERLARMRNLSPNVTALYSFRHDIEAALPAADLLVGAVLLPGKRSPQLVTREMIKCMRPGSVITDISVDQGGCVETSRPTSYADPVYIEEGVQHFTVTNMPGAVPRTSSKALSASLMGYVARLTRPDWDTHAALRAGINVRAGHFDNPVIRAELHDL